MLSHQMQIVFEQKLGLLFYKIGVTTSPTSLSEKKKILGVQKLPWTQLTFKQRTAKKPQLWKKAADSKEEQQQQQASGSNLKKGWDGNWRKQIKQEKKSAAE